MIKFIVPAIDVPVYTKKGNKRVKKKTSFGKVITTNKILPKERPRFSKTGIYTSTNTVLFSEHIRKCFFDKYDYKGVFYKGEPFKTYQFLGCTWFGEDKPCNRYIDKDFRTCSSCRYRRKNLYLYLRVFLKNERHIDLDNIVKIVLDSLEKTCFFNDSQFSKKEVDLIPYSESERLEISLSVMPTHFKHGSLVGAYTLKNLTIDDAYNYIKNIITNAPDIKEDVLKYVKRCDNRLTLIKRLLSEVISVERS
jgi:hypothetical protein